MYDASCVAGSQGGQQLLHDAACQLWRQLLVCTCQHSSQVRAAKLLAQIHAASIHCHIFDCYYVGMLQLAQGPHFPCHSWRQRCIWVWKVQLLRGHLLTNGDILCQQHFSKSPMAQDLHVLIVVGQIKGPKHWRHCHMRSRLVAYAGHPATCFWFVWQFLVHPISRFPHSACTLLIDDLSNLNLSSPTPAEL